MAREGTQGIIKIGTRYSVQPQHLIARSRYVCFMCTRNFGPLKNWPKEDRKIVMDYLKGKRSNASKDSMSQKEK